MPLGPTVEVATPLHSAELLDMWRTARAGASPTPERPSDADRVVAALADPRVRVLIARDGARAVGFASMTTCPLTGLSEARGLWVDQLFVVDGERRRGVGRTLLAAAERYAEQCGADQVVILTPVQARETNRFFARLGFGARMALRTAPRELLHKRLAPQESTGRDKTLARRRMLLKSRKEQVVRRTSLA